MTNETKDIEGAKAGSSSKQPTRVADTAASVQRLSVLYGLSEGTVRGFGTNWQVDDMKKRIYLDGTPIMSQDGTIQHDVEIDFREGSVDQTAINGVPSLTVETVVNVEVRFSAPVVRSFQRADVTAYDVRINVPRLHRGDSEGNLYGHSITFAIDVATASGSFSEYGVYTISEKVSQGLMRTYTVKMPTGDNRTIRVRRLTPESSDEFISDNLYVDAITEVVEVKLRYPHTALLWLRYDARQFSSAPKLEVLLDGKDDILIPLNYDPETRNYATSGTGTTGGVWNGQFKRGYTDNPVWHWYDLATNKRYGIGNRITMDIPDKFYLYSLAMYCDELVSDGKGGLEPRFTCNNLYLQKQEDAFTVFKDLSSIFRAKTIWDGTHLTPKMDVPRDAMLVFSRANTANITYSSISDAGQHNVIAVMFYDTANQYKAKYAYARSIENIARRGKIVDAEFTALGCTSEGQAQRAADYLLNTELTETDMISFTTGLDGLRPVVGDVFVFADDLLAGQVTSGRVRSVNGTEVTLDRPTNPKTTVGATFIVNTTEHMVSQRKVIYVDPENTANIIIDAPIDVVDITELVWALKSDDLGLREYTIDDIQFDADENTFTISGLRYNRAKYASSDDAARIVEPPVTIIDALIPRAPTSITASYNVVVAQGLNVCNIDVAWGQAQAAAYYQLDMRKDGGAWRTLEAKLTSLTYLVENAYAGVYEFRVRAFDVLGNASQYTTSAALNVQGKVLPPPRIDDLAVLARNFGITVSWSFPSGTLDTLTTRLQLSYDKGDTWTTIDVAYPQKEFRLDGLHSGLDVWVRAALVDKYTIEGEYSAWVSTVVTADPDYLLDVLTGHIGIQHVDNELAASLEAAANAGEVVTQAQQAAQAARDAAQAATDAADGILDVVSDLDDGLIALTKESRDGDTALGENIEAYKQSNDNALSIVASKADTAVDTASSAALATQLVQASLVDVNTKVENNASAITAAGAKVEEVEGKVSAQSDRIDVLESGLTVELPTIVGNTDSLDKWLYRDVNGITQTPNITINDNDSANGGKLFTVTDEHALISKASVPFNERATYQLTIRYRRLSGDGYLRFGVAAMDANKSLYVRNDNLQVSDFSDNAQYILNNVVPVTGDWVVSTCFIKGRSAGASSGAGTEDDMFKVAAKSQHLHLTASFNAVQQSGVYEFDFATLEDVSGTQAFSSAISSLTTKVSEVETGVSLMAAQVTQLDTKVGGYDASIQQAITAVDGMSASYTVKINNNGYASGFGLLSTGASGAPSSAFMVDADAFVIGKAGSGKIPFAVVTAGQVVDGVTYPEAGTYVKSGFIGKATIKLAHIDTASITSLSAISANLGTLTTTNSKGSMTISGGLIKGTHPNGVTAFELGLID